MRVVGLHLLAASLGLTTVSAQEQRIAVVAARQAAASVSSLPWFQHGFELVEAWLDVDLRTADRTAQELWQAAQHSAIPGLTATAVVTVGMVIAQLEGPNAAQPWFERAGTLPAGTDPGLEARYWLARARYLCRQGDHVEEVVCALPGRAAAERSGDPVLLVRAVAATAHVNEERSLALLAHAFGVAGTAGLAAETEHLRPLVTIEERNHAVQRADLELAQQLNEQLFADAQRLGNRRLLAFALANRANDLYRRKERAAALDLYEEIEQLQERLGDRHQLFLVRNMLAWAAMHREDWDTAAAAIRDLHHLIDGRGLVEDERELLATRFDLAVRTREGDLAADLKRQLDRFDSIAAAARARAGELRRRLLTAENARTAAEEQLRAEQAAAAESARTARTVGGVVVVIALTLLVAVAWRSRRRLLVANQRLAEQMRRIEEGQRTQARLEERMRALERTESLGTMAAGVAHDFNNLLTSILGSAELLRGQDRGGETAELAQTILLASEQATRLCRQLQAYAGGTPLCPAPLDLTDLVRSLLPALHAATRGAVALRLPAATGPVGVHGDRAQLEQVLLNLVVNAHDAGATVVDFGLRGPEGGSNLATLTATDNGHGMTAEVQQRIFDPFFTTRFPGRGLGLAVVHGIIRRHGGTIAVTSAPQRGTTFTIELPTAPPPEPVTPIPRPAPSATDTPSATGALFVIDDEASVRQMLVRLLRALGHEARAFADGQAALVALSTPAPTSPTIVFVDLTMPEIDGVEFARRLRGVRPDAVVVLMSGHPAEYVAQVAGDLRPDRVLGKPFTLSTVEGLLRDLLARPQTAPTTTSFTTGPTP